MLSLLNVIPNVELSGESMFFHPLYMLALVVHPRVNAGKRWPNVFILTDLERLFMGPLF